MTDHGHDHPSEHEKPLSGPALHVKALESLLTEKGLVDPVQAGEAWVNAQRFEFLTEVNVGSWSEQPVRDMAEEAGGLDAGNS